MVSKTRKVRLHVLAATDLSQVPSRLMDRLLSGSVGNPFQVRWANQNQSSGAYAFLVYRLQGR
jgi:hypothetical protein